MLIRTFLQSLYLPSVDDLGIPALEVENYILIVLEVEASPRLANPIILPSKL